MYVGNLSFNVTEQQVRDLFEPFGEIESLAMINDRDTGRFRGFCFIEMADADAQAAITALDGQDHMGRDLRVNEAKPRENNNRNRGGGGNYNNRRW